MKCIADGVKPSQRVLHDCISEMLMIFKRTKDEPHRFEAIF
jgi:hypothetical protein